MFRLLFYYFFAFIFLISCSGNSHHEFDTKIPVDTSKKISDKKIIIKKADTQNLIAMSSLVDIQSINSSIRVDLKYSSDDNFMHTKLYQRINRAYLQKDVAERLSKVQDALSKRNPGYKLLIYDALRPVSVQRRMWKALDSLPPLQRGKFVSNPDKRSLHNMGAAVDLTIIDELNNPLDMGAGFDDIREIAYPSMESYYLNTGQLTKKQLENRLLLRRLMQAQGFRQLETEWWHFNACKRSEALLKYEVLLEEF